MGWGRRFRLRGAWKFLEHKEGRTCVFGWWEAKPRWPKEAKKQLRAAGESTDKREGSAPDKE